jgi:tetratricopeptide (TPR) repeat protein
MLYARAATFDFVHADDADLIAGNQAFLSDPGNLPRAFTRSYFEVEGESNAQKTYYRPVAIASFMLDAATSGASPRAYHATNAVLHAAAVCLLMMLATTWGAPTWAALAAALVFAVHPLNVQAVAWIAGRNDLLMAVFGLVSLIGWIAMAEAIALPAWSTSSRSATASAVAIHIVAFGLALFSKETGLFFPLIALLHQLAVRRERIARVQWIALGGDAAVVIAWGLLRSRALAGMPSELSTNTLAVVVSNAPQVLMLLRKMVMPVRLNVAPGVDGSEILAGAVVLILVAIAAWKYLLGRLRLLASVWVLLFVIPTLAVPGLPAYEHRAYVPMLGILAVSATGLAGHKGPPYAVVGYLGAVILVFAAFTYQRQDAFRDPFAYWTDATRDTRFGPIAHVNLGQLHEAAGRPREARREYLRALERDANTPKAHNNLGVVLMTLNEPDLALAHFREETERHAWNADAWFNLGLWMETRGQPAAAQQYYERAIEANPSYAPAYEKLGRRPPR